jgi:hypothetical protein
MQPLQAEDTAAPTRAALGDCCASAAPRPLVGPRCARSAAVTTIGLMRRPPRPALSRPPAGFLIQGTRQTRRWWTPCQTARRSCWRTASTPRRWGPHDTPDPRANARAPRPHAQRSGMRTSGVHGFGWTGKRARGGSPHACVRMHTSCLRASPFPPHAYATHSTP